MAQDSAGLRDVAGWIKLILGPDSVFVKFALVYGGAISLLSLATPISVQLLVNSVANVALSAPLFTLAGILFGLLLMVGLLSALRIRLMSLFERRLFARMVAEITLRAVHAKNPFFADAGNGHLFNRFFDLMTVQKALPSLLIGGFTILLQSAVGLVVTSFYHPFFLGFNLLLVTVLVLILQLWTRGGIRTAIAKSHAKHATAYWLESVGGSNGFYQSSRHLEYAIDRSEESTRAYVKAHERHFRYTFTQTVCLLFTYALASASLLALGGWLIIQGQLSIGQLVAAELILSGVFYGMSQLGSYLESFYDLSAGVEELALFWGIPQQASTGDECPADGTIRMKGVEIGSHRFNFAIDSGKQIAIVAAPTAQQAFIMLLKRHEAPEQGLVVVGGQDISAFDMFRLRSDIRVLDRPTMVEMSIRDYLRLAAGGEERDIMAALDVVGLTSRLVDLRGGLDAVVSASGYPLSVGEVMALKLAAALLARPKVLVLTPLYDLLPPARMEGALRLLRDMGTTVLQFTRRPEGIKRDGYLWFGRSEQRFCMSEPEMSALAAQEESVNVRPA
ncbi:ABC transporter ATP-binding protein [Novosphingobium flavum]|uniref:ABC transporter ATP-binding protein n=1 Tax=Novosphingobium aerophilum TaxID=2839843 RepID=A0A7X1F7F1_9SPHN|nr:ABC transporter ATP-binding protein [Novosphingobium aerophilum]MBC2651752.1 ABC transporter ATP-binding protein [Novosphingobium aerophilum]MBC2662060.1 ABC transporter ATP-binding protein [Novosphingobium aerophilum]